MSMGYFAKRSKYWREKMKRKKRCTQCGRPLGESKRVRCLKCLEKKRIKDRIARLKIIEKGLCVRCRAPQYNNTTHCKKCLDKKKRYRRKKLDRNLCDGCSKPLDRDGIECSICAEKRSIRENKQIKERRDAHICTRCGKELVDSGGKLCILCKGKRVSKYYSAKENYRCVDCGNAMSELDILVDGALCATCIDIRRMNRES